MAILQSKTAKQSLFAALGFAFVASSMLWKRIFKTKGSAFVAPPHDADDLQKRCYR